jgi:hypothetical protein
MQLELLFLLAREPGVAWTAQAAGRELRAPVAWVETQLVDFAGAGVIAYDESGEPAYRLPADALHAEVVEELADAYRQRRTSIIKFIFAPAARDITSFSDAFRLRDEEDGD